MSDTAGVKACVLSSFEPAGPVRLEDDCFASPPAKRRDRPPHGARDVAVRQLERAANGDAAAVARHEPLLPIAAADDCCQQGRDSPERLRPDVLVLDALGEDELVRHLVAAESEQHLVVLGTNPDLDRTAFRVGRTDANARSTELHNCVRPRILDDLYRGRRNVLEESRHA